MADPTDNIGDQDMFAYRVLWKTKTVGLVKELDPSGVKHIKKAQTATPFGEMVLGHRIRGAGGTIKTVLHQPRLNVIKLLCPWWVSGPVPGVPADLNFDTYAASGPLVFHPWGVAVDALDDDTTFLKAFPTFSMSKAGGDWRELSVEWDFYPDRAQLVTGVVATHYFGAPPA